MGHSNRLSCPGPRLDKQVSFVVGLMVVSITADRPRLNISSLHVMSRWSNIQLCS
jgi:hypothetical protein